MQNSIKEELQQIIPSNLISSEEELSDVELESVAGGAILTGTNVRAQVRVFGINLPAVGPISGTVRVCSFGISIPLLGSVPSSYIEGFSRK